LIRLTRLAKTSDMKLTFALPLDDPPGDVSVVGTFNDWTPGKHRLVKRANATRSVSVTIPVGTTVRFRYLGENGLWFDEPHADTIDLDGCTISV
jgi:hypothetical protein